MDLSLSNLIYNYKKIEMKFKNTKVQRTINEETGEVIEVLLEKEFTTKVNPDKFYMTFIETIAPLYNLTSLSDLKLMIKFCELAEYETGRVIFATGIRKEVCEQLNISTNSISISLKSLVKKKLISGEKGIYIINPEIFWKGSAIERKKLMKKAELKIKFELS